MTVFTERTHDNGFILSEHTARGPGGVASGLSRVNVMFTVGFVYAAGTVLSNEGGSEALFTGLRRRVQPWDGSTFTDGTENETCAIAVAAVDTSDGHDKPGVVIYRNAEVMLASLTYPKDCEAEMLSQLARWPIHIICR